MKGIRDQDYEHAQQVCNTMEKKTLGCYHDTYLKTNVWLKKLQIGSSPFLRRTRTSMTGLIRNS